jgi:hypothetical protein
MVAALFKVGEQRSCGQKWYSRDVPLKTGGFLRRNPKDPANKVSSLRYAPGIKPNRKLRRTSTQNSASIFSHDCYTGSPNNDNNHFKLPHWRRDKAIYLFTSPVTINHSLRTARRALGSRKSCRAEVVPAIADWSTQAAHQNTSQPQRTNSKQIWTDSTSTILMHVVPAIQFPCRIRLAES